MITTFDRGSEEYKALEAAAALLTALSPNGTDYKVKDVYFDFGQDWKWTTIVAYKKDGNSWQALNPKEHELITLFGTLESITQAVESVMKDKFNPDR